jgi:uncharacterized membrane protein YczE
LAKDFSINVIVILFTPVMLPMRVAIVALLRFDVIGLFLDH